MKVLEAPLDAISRQAREYPAYLLREQGDGLCLFAARFYGVNDAIHMARAEMNLTLVDLSARVLEMGGMYGCAAYVADAWEFAETMRAEGAVWDNVSVDTYTGDLMRRSLESLDLWCSLARESVTVTHTTGEEFVVPDGWADVGLFERNPRNGVSWLVLTRA